MIRDRYEFNEIVNVRPNVLIFPQHADIFNVYFFSVLGRYTFPKKMLVLPVSSDNMSLFILSNKMDDIELDNLGDRPVEEEETGEEETNTDESVVI